LEEFRDLDAEAAQTTVTDTRKLQITQRKAQIFSEFTKLQAVTKEQLKSYEATWRAALI
jgi:anti-sigma-K factor RskA